MIKRILLYLLLLSPMAAFSQTYSAIDRFSLANAKDVITRYDNATNYTVTCYHEGWKSYFIVSNQNSSFYFYTTPPTNPMIGGPDSGYVVKDVRICGSICYFCGSYWYEPGNMIQTMGGLWMRECTYQGFVGKFTMSNAVIGSPNFGILTLQGTKSLDKMHVDNSDIVAIGVTENGYTSCVAEIHPSSIIPVFPLTFSNYDYKVSIPSHTDEVFTDIDGYSGQTVIVSRFNDTNQANRYYKYFGIRTGKSSDFKNDNSMISYYNTDPILSQHAVTFNSVDTLHVSMSEPSSDIVVSYIGSYGGAALNKLVLLRIHNRKIVQVQYNGDLENYTRLRDLQHHDVYEQNMVALLEREDGASVLRFPKYSITGNDTLLYNSYRMQSISPYKVGSGTYNTVIGGYNPNDGRKVIVAEQEYRLGGSSLWANSSCSSIGYGYMNSVNLNLSPQDDANVLDPYSSKTFQHFIQHPFTPSSTTKYNVCTNGN